MKNILGILVILITLTSPVFAQEAKEEASVKVTVGNFMESSTKRFDYNMTYMVVSSGDLRVQIDRFDNPQGLLRSWVNYGSLKLIDEEEVKLSFSPGILVSNRDQFYAGGFLDLDVGNGLFHIHHRGFAGNKKDKHVTFTNLKLSDNVSLQHYYYMEHGWKPDSYIGPAINLGDFYCWGGPSTNRPGAWALDAGFSIKF